MRVPYLVDARQRRHTARVPPARLEGLASLHKLLRGTPKRVSKTPKRQVIMDSGVPTTSFTNNSSVSRGEAGFALAIIRPAERLLT